MKLFSSLAPVAIVAIILVAVGVHRGSPISEDLGLIDAEGSRLTAHFDSVTGILGATDVSRLTSLERGNRERALQHLVDYRDRGVFPHNHDFPGMPVPYFRDRHGVLCAMAYLIDRSGRGDIVDLVEARMNNGWIAELANDSVIGPVLVEWLEENGISAREAAMIQPAYNGRNGLILVSDSDVPTAYGVASAGLGAVNLFTGVANLVWETGPTFLAPVGVVMGGAGVVLGATAFDNGGDRAILGVADAAIGMASLLLSLNRMLRSGEEGEGMLARSDKTWTPIVFRGSSSTRVGVNLRF